MLSSGRNQFALAPSLSIFAGLVIAITVLSINLFDGGPCDTLDPRQQR
jgi:ABC-type dipeptide/oligopeptide/nickel transport system permease subunit